MVSFNSTVARATRTTAFQAVDGLEDFGQRSAAMAPVTIASSASRPLLARLVAANHRQTPRSNSIFQRKDPVSSRGTTLASSTATVYPLRSFHAVSIKALASPPLAPSH